MSSLCHVGNTCSHLNTGGKQHWASTILRWVTAWELLVLLTKTKAGLHCGSIWAKQMGSISLLRCTGSGQVWTLFRTACWRPLQIRKGLILLSVDRRKRNASRKVAPLDSAASKIFVEDYSRLFFSFIRSISWVRCLTIISHVVQV